MANSLEIIKNILVNEMNLPKTRVWAYNADMDLPKDNKLFVILHYGERRPISNNVKYVSTDEGLEEHQSMNVVDDVIISLLSRGTDARERAHEVHLAFRSTYSQQRQAKEHVHISTLGDVYDASFLEATSRINRFDCRVRVFNSFDKIKTIDYYDKFPNTSVVEVTTNIEP